MKRHGGGLHALARWRRLQERQAGDLHRTSAIREAGAARRHVEADGAALKVQALRAGLLSDGVLDLDRLELLRHVETRAFEDAEVAAAALAAARQATQDACRRHVQARASQDVAERALEASRRARRHADELAELDRLSDLLAGRP